MMQRLLYEPSSFPSGKGLCCLFFVWLWVSSNLFLVHGKPTEEAVVSSSSWQWTTSAQGTIAHRLPGRIGRGNALVASSDTVVIVTTDNGQLHAIDLVANFTKTYTPEPWNNDNGDTTSWRCESGTGQLVAATGNWYYAIVATQSDNSNAPLGSRVLVVQEPSSSDMEWSLQASIDIQGAIVGTPVLGSHYLYVVHNVPEEDDPTTSVGRITLIDTESYTVTTTLPYTQDSTGRAFGAPAVQTSEQDIDVVVWGEYRPNEEQGALYALAVSGSNQWTFSLVSESARSAVAAPAISQQLDVYLGQYAAFLLGWTQSENLQGLLDNDRRFSGTPSWGYEVLEDEQDPNLPISTSPVLSSDGTLLFVASPGAQVNAITTDNGRSAWADETFDTSVSAKPLYQEQNGAQFVYFLSESGMLRQYNASTGDIIWETGCGLSSCPDVLGDIDLSPNGDFLYYADVEGNLVQVQLTISPSSETVPPTAKPTTFPTDSSTTKAPESPVVTNETATPSLTPVKGPDDNEESPQTSQNATSNNTTNPTNSASDSAKSSSTSTTQEMKNWITDNLLIVLGAACGVLLALIAAIVCIPRYRKRSKQGKRNSSRAVNDSGTLSDDEEGGRRQKSRENSPNMSGSPETTTLTAIVEESLVENEHDDHDSVSRESLGFEIQNHPSMTEHCDEADTFSDVEMANSSNPNEESSILSLSRDTIEEDVIPSPSAVTTPDNPSGKNTDTFEEAAASTLPTHIREENEKIVEQNASQSHSVIQKIFPSVSMSKSFSPLPSPTPSYVEPGRCLPGELVAAPISPTHSMMSADDSLYMDESTVASLEVNVLEHLHSAPDSKVEDALSGKVEVSDPPSDTPEDEGTGKLRPGSHYLSRHKAKKDQDPVPSIRSAEATKRAPRPIYAGVSVRPSRSRAGLFSRMHGRPADQDEEGHASSDANNLSSRSLPTKLPKKPKSLVQPSLEEPPSPPHFTAHGYYVEETHEKFATLSERDLTSSSKRKSEKPKSSPRASSGKKLTGHEKLVNSISVAKETKKRVSGERRMADQHSKQPVKKETKADPWSSFLSELTRVEKQFFNPTTTSNKKTTKPNSHSSGPPPPPPPPDVDSDSDYNDEEDNSSDKPPPPPKTFFA